MVAAPNIEAAVPIGKSGIRFVGLLLLLHVFIDGSEVHPDTNGDVVVTPGLRHWEIRSQDGLTVLASGTIFCPTCVGRTITPPPTDTLLPPAAQANFSIPTLAGVAVIFVAVLALLLMFPRRR